MSELMRPIISMFMLAFITFIVNIRSRKLGRWNSLSRRGFMSLRTRKTSDADSPETAKLIPR